LRSDGERWKGDHAFRPAIEDLIGAGAIIHHLTGTLSPEARLAVGAFLSVRDDLPRILRECSSGKELVERGFPQDVTMAAEINVDDCAPLLLAGAFQQAEPTG
jgi:2-phosphosulfolactate phosphatase